MSCNCHHCHEHEHEHEHEHSHGCSCGHGHDHAQGSMKADMIKIVLSAILLALAMFLPLWDWLKFALFIAAYLVVGSEVLHSAGKNILHGEIFDEAFLMTLATLGAFIIGEYPEAVLVMLLFQVGELFEHLAERKSRRSIASLMDLRPDEATVERDGELITLDPAQVAVGEVIVVKPGERIPLDGVILSGASTLDTAALTGEALPKNVDVGDSVLSGCVNLTGLLSVSVTKAYGDSTVAKILDMVENAAAGKTKSETFIQKFSRWYTPIVVALALLLAVVPSLLTGEWRVWILRALNFLVISCPCALVVSVPLSYFGGIGAASKKGILVKGSHYLESLADIKTAVFDKTGTLTHGRFTVTEVCAQNGHGEALLHYAALAESCSNHPLAVSIRQACGEQPASTIQNAEELAGLGVAAKLEGKTILAGNNRLMEKYGIAFQNIPSATAVHVALDGEYLGYILLEDAPKEDASKAIRGLREMGVDNIVMLTGDKDGAAAKIAAELELDAYHAELLPQDKVRLTEGLRKEKDSKVKLLFAGDGVNDAPVLALADVGVAMGAFGSDAAMEAADVVLMDDQPSKLILAMKIARKTRNIVRQNIAFSIGVKVLFLALSAAGLVNLGLAIFADVGVLILAVMNAVRALNVPK